LKATLFLIWRLLLVLSLEHVVVKARVFTNDNFAPWFAPAGVVRGKVQGLISLETQYGLRDRDLLQGGTNIVNPIAKIGSHGILIYGQKTATRSASGQLARINVRSLQNYIQRMIIKETGEYVFDQNDSYTWDAWKLMVDKVMREIKVARGLYDYLIEMHPTDVEIDRYQMPGTILYKPEKAAEFIQITFDLLGKSSDKI